ncbi:MAG: ATP-binding cassette domain-containing protein [Parvularculaceae bacterium]
MNKRETFDISKITPAIELADLVVEVRDKTIEVHNWSVARGGSVALIGPNGSGKTTIIETILGLRKAASLKGNVLGTKLQSWNKSADLRRTLGVQLQGMALPFGLYIRDLMKLHKDLYGDGSESVARGLGMYDLAEKIYERLSRGEMQRVELYLALAHSPELIILDEPFTGLDQQFAQATSQLLRDSLNRGCTLLMACHSPPELALANKIAWINDGKILHYMEPDQLRMELLGEARLHANFASPVAAEKFLKDVTATVSLKFCRAVSDTECVLFADKALMDFAKDLVENESIVSLEVGRTTPTDLLLRCAQDERNV